MGESKKLYLIPLIGSAVTIVLGIATLGLIIATLVHPTATGITAAQGLGAGATVFALIISPIIVIVFSVIGMKFSENKTSLRLIFNIITLCLVGVTILLGAVWVGMIGAGIIPYEPEMENLMNGISITVIIAIIVQVLVGVGSVLNIVIK